MLQLQGPTTTREISFVQAYGRDLHEAREACRAYTTYGETAMLDRAWDIYYGVCRIFTGGEYPLTQTMFAGLQEDREAAPTTDNSGLTIRFAGSVESS